MSVKAIMEDFLSGWTVNENVSAPPTSVQGRSPGRKKNGMGSSDSFIGVNVVGSPTTIIRRVYGWHSSKASSGSFSNRPHDVHSRRGNYGLHCSEYQRLALMKHSPYCVSMRPKSLRKRFAKGRADVAKSAEAFCSHNDFSGASQTLTSVSKLRATSPRSTSLSRSGQSPARSNKALSVALKRQLSSSPPRSAAGKFFCALAKTYILGSRKKRSDFLTSLSPCDRGGGATSAVNPRRGRSTQSGCAITNDVQSEPRQNGTFLSSYERYGRPVTQTDYDEDRYIKDWEAVCAKEKEAAAKHAAASKKLRELQKQVDEVTIDIESGRRRELLARKQMREFTKLRTDVIRQEKKSKEMRRLAILAKRRLGNIFVSLEAADEASLSTGSNEKLFFLESRASIIEQRSELERQKTNFKRALSEEAAKKSAASSPSTSATPLLPQPPPQSLKTAVAQRLPQLQLLEQTMTGLKKKEQHLRVMTKRSEMRTEELLDCVDALRAANANPPRQPERKTESFGEEGPETTPPGYSNRSFEEKSKVILSPPSHCFITEVVA